MKESDIQIQIVEYLQLIKNIVFFSVPNEAFAPKKGKLTGQQLGRMARFKRMGLRSGVSDLIIGHNGKMYCMEVKLGKGKQTDNQISFMEDSFNAGCEYKIVRSFESAVECLREWGIR